MVSVESIPPIGWAIAIAILLAISTYWFTIGINNYIKNIFTFHRHPSDYTNQLLFTGDLPSNWNRKDLKQLASPCNLSENISQYKVLANDDIVCEDAQKPRIKIEINDVRSDEIEYTIFEYGEHIFEKVGLYAFYHGVTTVIISIAMFMYIFTSIKVQSFGIRNIQMVFSILTLTHIGILCVRVYGVSEIITWDIEGDITREKIDKKQASLRKKLTGGLISTYIVASFLVFIVVSAKGIGPLSTILNREWQILILVYHIAASILSGIISHILVSYIGVPNLVKDDDYSTINHTFPTNE